MSFRKELRVNGVDDYVIDFVETKSGKWAVYPRVYPHCPYELRDAHFLEDGRLCIDASVAPRMKRWEFAVAVAKAWASGFSQFIRTGQFPNDGGNVSV